MQLHVRSFQAVRICVTPFSILLAGLTFCLAASLAAAPAEAWGCKGHQTVALIAERHLTPEAKEAVISLLTRNPIAPDLKRYCGNALTDAMADASTWPDDVRGERNNGPWHYIDIPRGAQRGPAEKYCGKEGCVTRAITEQVAIAKDSTADGVKRAEALRYVIHFVGDMHQPLHGTTNADEGGNCVPVKYLRRAPQQHSHGFSPNLHGLWDTAIPERDMEGADPAEYADTLERQFAASIPGWQKAGIHLDDWAWESHDFAESITYGALTPKIAVEPDVPVRSCADDNNIGERLLRQHIAAGDAYQQAAAPVVEERLEQAGVRLAMILNEVFPGAH